MKSAELTGISDYKPLHLFILFVFTFIAGRPYIYPREFSRLYNVYPWYWNTLFKFYSLICTGENSAFGHFPAAIATHCNLAFSFHQSLLG